MSAARRLKERDEDRPGGQAYEVTKPVELLSLADAIRTAHGWRADLALITEGDPAQASPENPVVLWVMREDARASTVRSAVTAHQGVETERDLASEELAVLRAKVADGDALTETEVQTALRLLLTRGT